MIKKGNQHGHCSSWHEIFKAYDIRGIYPSDLNEETAYRIGRAFVSFLNCKNVVVGRDMRNSSDALFKSLARGITDQGADVIDIGLSSTPMFYYASGRLEAEGGIIITASHNPSQYNGFKLCRDGTVPVSGATGLKDVKALFMKCRFGNPEKRGSVIKNEEIKDEYVRHVRSFSKQHGNLKVVVDCANAMGVYEMRPLQGLARIIPMFDKLDGSFPNHEANPLKFETVRALQNKVVEEKADLGIAFDGDADRVGFIDEKGCIVPMDLTGALIAEEILKKEKGTILYDLRCSRAVKETIVANGGTPIETRVGHTFIKQAMRERNALFVGEFSGHYYFRDNYYTESSSLAAVYLLNIMVKYNKKISELIKPLRKYYQSGEVNSGVEDKEAVIKKLAEVYCDGGISYLDGIKVVFGKWWFNVRPSN
ncbi:phosphomannomutase/phosphoglucomutase, partial [Candidatus Woesearchaeota archaeon CG10_big_fil_rev_8_21_14_0_10_47_5]